MKALVVIVLLVFLVGCAEKVVEPIEPTPITPKQQLPVLSEVAETEPMPELGPVEEPGPDSAEPDTAMKSLDDVLLEREVKPIGTRLHETEEAASIPVEGDLVTLDADKLMIPDAIIIAPGTSVTWQNDDSAPHIILIEQDGERLVTGDRTEAGESYTYTFNMQGIFEMRDMFSGSMRGTVTVE